MFDGLDALERETEQVRPWTKVTPEKYVVTELTQRNQKQVNKLKAAYDKKCQIADEASDYARFSSDPSRQPTVMSPSSSIQEDDEDDESFGVDDPTLLPRSGQKTDSTSPTSAGTGMFGFGSLASRASGLVRSISKRAPPSASQALVDRINRDSAKHAVIEGEKSEEKSAGDADEAPAPKLDKGKGKEVFPDDEKKEDSKPAVSPAVPTKEWLLIGGGAWRLQMAFFWCMKADLDHQSGRRLGTGADFSLKVETRHPRAASMFLSLENTTTFTLDPHL